MRKLLAIFFVAAAVSSFGQVLWFEDFEGEADGAQTGVAAGTIGGGWTATYGGAGTFSKESPLGFNLFQISNTTTQGVWNMNAPISIAGTGRAIVEMNVVGFFIGAGDVFQAYYRVDGGPEILFFEQNGALLSFNLTGTAIVTGSTLEVIVRSTVVGGNSFTFNDVRITGVNTLYSRKSGNWDDVTATNGTWSVIGIGGASCDCSPIATDYLIVGASHTVNINVAATAGAVEIRNGGGMQYTVDNVDLNIDRGILQVDAGGTIDRNGRTGVQIDFDRGVLNTFVNNGTVTTETIEVTAAFAGLFISGTGSIVLTGDFNILADDIIVDNDLNGTFTIGDDLIFDQPGDIFADDAQFINRRTLTILSNLVVGANNDDGNIFTNAAGATLNVVNINANDADFFVLNSGTINQTGNFLNIVAGSGFDNLATGVWNWNFVQAAFDAQMNNALDCSAVGNTFNYGAAGNQNIVAVAYHHLTMSNSGTKITTNNLDINGNLLISGTARLDPNTGNDNITLAGNWNVTSTNANPFDEGTETVTLDGSLNTQNINTVLAGGESFNNLIFANTFATAPQLSISGNVAVASVLTMTSGIVDLGGNILTITSNAAGSLVYTNGWMYNGSLARAMANAGITLGTVRGHYPLGTATNYRPFFVGKPGGTGAGTTTILHNGTLTTTSVVAIADDLPITRRHDSFWTVSSTYSGVAATWSLWAGGTGFGTIASTAHLRVSTAAGVVGTPGVNTGTTADPRVERLTVSIDMLKANNFHIASVDAVNSPLPIELTSFAAVVEFARVRLNWITESELNNDYFTLERTIDAEHFETLATVPGKGTTTAQSSYRLYDDYPFPGVSYYRLKQTDFDGFFTYSGLIKVVTEISKAQLTAFPNPSTNKVTTLDVRGLAPGEEIQLVITDLRGVQAFSGMYHANANGSLRASVDLSMAASGLYVVRLFSSSLLTQTKLVVE